ncbi:MAG: DNA-binding response OmpR family regulator [Desulforhopalus sp.]|jgi:DNA-binding response OmpR family regulator
MLESPILIVEDDKNTSNLVATYLQREGFTTIVAYDGERALTLARLKKPGFVILDVMLPKVDGWEICRELRKVSDVPILMLTAREEEIDRILGLSLGADDYVVKPFSPRELVERVKAILRRTQPRVPTLDDVLSYNGLTLDSGKCKVTLNGEVINLTTSEYKLLRILMGSPGQVFSRDTLLARFYEHGETVVERVIDVHIGKIRQKIEENPSQPKFILTVRGFGYTFAENEGA